MVMWLLMWWEWTPPPAKLTHCWRCGSWWCGPCPLEPSFPPQTPSLEWTIRGDPMSLIQEFNDLPFRRRALKNICWLGYTHVSSVPAWKKHLIPEDSRISVVLPLELKTFVSLLEEGKAGLGQESGNLPSLLAYNIQGVKCIVALWLHESILAVIAEPVLGQAASYCVGQGPQKSWMKGWGRPPRKFSNNFWE